MLPSLSALRLPGAATDAYKRDADGNVIEESEDDKNMRLFRRFLGGDGSAPTFSSDSIDPAKLLAGIDARMLSEAVDNDPDDAAWPKAIVAFLATHPQYAKLGNEMLESLDAVIYHGLNFPYVSEWPSLASWTDEEIQRAMSFVSKAFELSDHSVGLIVERYGKLGPATFSLMPPKTWWSVWQDRGNILTIGDVLKVREGTAIPVIPWVTQGHTTTFSWLTSDDDVFTERRESAIGQFYAYESSRSVNFDDYDRLRAEGSLDKLLNAYAVTGSGADLWVKLSPKLIGLAYGWAAQLERAEVRDADRYSATLSPPRGVWSKPRWFEAIENDEEEQAFQMPTVDEVFEPQALAWAVDMSEE